MFKTRRKRRARGNGVKDSEEQFPVVSAWEEEKTCNAKGGKFNNHESAN